MEKEICSCPGGRTGNFFITGTAWHAFAADPVTSEEQTVSPEAPEFKDVTDSTDAATTDANLTTPDSVSDSVSDSVAGTSQQMLHPLRKLLSRT